MSPFAPQKWREGALLSRSEGRQSNKSQPDDDCAKPIPLAPVASAGGYSQLANSKVCMMVELLVRDQNIGMQPSQTIAITISSERISIREIIRSRVYQAVQDLNLKRQSSDFLHQPSGIELELNGPRRIKAKSWQRQFELATEAFDSGRLLVLVDDRQAETLDEEVEVIHSKTLVTFLRLVPLVGG